MDNPRAEKVAVVDEVREHFDSSDAAILTEYRGLKVKDLAGLRRALRPSGAEYRIYKNTLVTLAARESGLAGLEELLKGPTAIAFVKGDAAAVAKSLRDYSRTNPLLVIKGGVLGEKVIGPAETAALADLPSREVLLAQFAGALAAPLQQMAGLLQALPRNFAYGLAALRDKRAENDGAPGDQPMSEAPSGDAAASSTPTGTAAEADAPEADAPEAATPAVEAPEADAPAVEAPEADAPEAAAPEAATPAVEAPEAATAPAGDDPAAASPEEPTTDQDNQE